MTQQASILSQLPSWTRQPGAQAIPGYRLIEPLGRGGFGEVWKCEAPGGLFKAIKFVPNRDEADSPAKQEREALQRVKSIRHPFILSLERVEVVDNVLVIVMELADKSLHSLLGDYQGKDRPGIPREELLGYLLEAAEALDWMNFGHGLQHLDIKPHNLFLVSNHVKVADFGLVDSLSDVEKSHPQERHGGVTPLYAAPELLGGTVSRHCDQYSLAIVYQQLLTGTVPFWCRNMYQLMVQHLSSEPNLTPLPEQDRSVISRALAKKPDDRFPSCLDFLQALVCGGNSGGKVDLARRAAAVKKIVSQLRAEDSPTQSVRRLPTPTKPSIPSAGNEQVSTRSVPATVAHPSLAWNPAASAAATPICESLPGYRFLQCISQSPLGDVWSAQDEQGNPRRALCLPVPEPSRDRQGAEASLESLLQGLRSIAHPALPPAVVAVSSSGQLIVLTEVFERTLRDRLEECQKHGLPGIPREELLGHLRKAAEALDALHERYGLAHLALNPRSLVLQKGELWLTEFGLAALVRLPAGHKGSELNGRYTAPELSDKPASVYVGEVGPASDQYSLALIYAELLSGASPRPPRPGSGSHAIVGGRRESVAQESNGRLVPVGRRCAPRIDADLMPACDRSIVQRALHDNPAERYASCTALIEALESAVAHTERVAKLYDRLPAVIPFPSLHGEPPAKDAVLPPVRQLILNLAAPALSSCAASRIIPGPQNVRYVQNGHLWECKCPIQTFTGALPIKVEGFRSEWKAKTVREETNSFLFHIELPSPPRAEERSKGPPPPMRLAFELDVQLAIGSPKHYAEARMCVRPDAEDDTRLHPLLPDLAPRLFHSMRGYLQAGIEQRGEDRWQCPQPLHVYPVLPNLELDEVLEGISRNISLSGVSFRVAQAPHAEKVYLHWHKSEAASPWAVLVRIIRVQPMAGGGFEVGATFPQTDRLAPAAGTEWLV